MIKTKLKKSEVSPAVELLLYSSLTPIPFSITFGNNQVLPETIYARNLSNENFIEFRFDKNNKQLYEISLVAIDTRNVEELASIEENNLKATFFNCLIDEENSELESVDPVVVYRSKDTIKVVWGAERQHSASYFSLSPNCYIGVDINSCLASVALTALTEEEIFNILGF